MKRGAVVIERKEAPPKTKSNTSPGGPGRRGPRAPAITPFKKRSKGKVNNNIFRQAKQLLDNKPVLEMNEEELEVVKIATMPLLLLRHFSNLSIDEGLEELAKMVDGID